ncbi:MAG TPA: FtsX-like permease family protein [Pirellulales bacterium]|jgi:hypothetical protein|nr:FtsX-like permease family protein [Pirellulales bacterium]
MALSAAALALPPGTRLPIALAVVALLVAALALVGSIPVGYNLRNLTVRWRTTLLTALAFTLVVGLMTVMLAFVAGMNHLTEQSGQPGNVIVLSDGATDELFSNLNFVDAGDIERQRGVLRNDAGQPLASREVYIVVTQPVIGPSGETLRRRFSQVRGIDDPAMAGAVHGLELFPGGNWFSQAGVETLMPKEMPAAATGAPAASADRPAIQAVLGEGAARQLGAELGQGPLAVGDTFELGMRRWVIVGILQSTGSTFGSEIWAKRSVVAPLFGKADNYTSIVLRTAGADEARAVSTDLNDHFKKAALAAQPETQYFSKLGETNRQFAVTIAFVTIVMSIGGVFGVMNTMFAAVSQRTKDIGVLRILGFARWQIVISFFLESLLIAVIGGALGCAVGYLADGLQATSVVSSGQGSGKTITLQLLVTRQILMTGMLLALGMGALGGLIPALAAMRLRPLESMR